MCDFSFFFFRYFFRKKNSFPEKNFYLIMFSLELDYFFEIKKIFSQTIFLKEKQRRNQEKYSLKKITKKMIFPYGFHFDCLIKILIVN